MDSLKREDLKERLKMNRAFEARDVYKLNPNATMDDDTINLGDVTNNIQQPTKASWLPVLLAAAIAGLPGAYAAYQIANMTTPKTELKEGDLISQPPSFGLDGAEIITE
jgi:hypothetical protein